MFEFVGFLLRLILTVICLMIGVWIGIGVLMGLDVARHSSRRTSKSIVYFKTNIWPKIVALNDDFFDRLEEFFAKPLNKWDAFLDKKVRKIDKNEPIAIDIHAKYGDKFMELLGKKEEK